jgi:isopenicillin N synthase-like dioxygenase
MADLVPTIDLTPWWLGDDEARCTLAAAVDDACRVVGFVRVAGHGVRPSLVERMLAVTSEFFDLPAEVKCRYGPACPEVERGYRLGAPGRSDLFESFTMGVDRWPAGDPYYECQRNGLFAPNIWPGHPAVMGDVWTEYFDAMQELADWLMEIFALALGRPEGYFTAGCSRAPDVMRASNYERRPGAPPPLPGQMRLSAHADHGACTVLLADPVPGLQIVGPDGTWHDVRSEPGTLLVNPGDVLAEWTNQRWRSTVHRVVPPPADLEGPARRRSVAFVRDVDHDVRTSSID